MVGGFRGGMIGAVIAAAAIALGIGLLAQRLDGDKREVRSSIVAPEKPVVMRTRGGLLEVATVRALERFTREDSRDFWGIDLGTTLMEQYTRTGWARFNKEENLEALQRSMTPTLAARASGDAYRGLAEEAARKTIAEFITIWLLKETEWKRDPAHKVVVLFPDEARPPLP